MDNLGLVALGSIVMAGLTIAIGSIAPERGKKILDVTGLRWSSHYKVTVVQQMLYQLLEKLYMEFSEARIEK